MACNKVLISSLDGYSPWLQNTLKAACPPGKCLRRYKRDGRWARRSTAHSSEACQTSSHITPRNSTFVGMEVKEIRVITPREGRDATGVRNLEPHHTRRLSDGGPDDPRHVVAICPKCHRRVHHGKDGEQLGAGMMAYLAGLT
jgi:hypothetical protein